MFVLSKAPSNMKYGSFISTCNHSFALRLPLHSDLSSGTGSSLTSSAAAAEMDEGDAEDEFNAPDELVIQGSLSKWTNYVTGWQARFFVLKGGTLSYFKSAQETGLGCRGAVSLCRAVVTAHSIDENRFDLCVGDHIWYLRCESPDLRATWIRALESYRSDLECRACGLRRQGSALSLASGSAASRGSFRPGYGVREKLAEIETFREMLSRQLDTLQAYFDLCSQLTASATVSEPAEAGLMQQHAGHAKEFRSEAVTFKVTTAGIIHQMRGCLDLMSQREDLWKKRLERQVDKRRYIEDTVRALQQRIEATKQLVGTGPLGPDYEEGPCCRLDEEEFFDAVDAQLDRMDEAASSMSRLRASRLPSHGLDPEHPLASEIVSVCQAHWDSWGASTAGMELLESDGPLNVYRSRLEQEGAAVDPILAMHTVTGVSAREVAEIFWNLQYRLDWEHTLDSAPTVLDTLASDTLLLHQIYKRLWPTAQRDSVFWSHIRHAEQRTMVVNCSTEIGAPPLVSGRQRMQLNVSLICETEMPEGRLPTERSQLRCRLQYSATVHPGGWAPMAVLRQVAKREYPKFLRRFTSYCIDRVKHMPVQL